MMEKAKAIVGAIGLVVTALTAILADDVFDINEIGTLVVVLIEAGATIWAIWRVPNAGFVKVPTSQNRS